MHLQVHPRCLKCQDSFFVLQTHSHVRMPPHRHMMLSLFIYLLVDVTLVFFSVAMAKYSYKSSLRKGRFVLLVAEGTASSSCQGSHGCRGWKQPVTLHGRQEQRARDVLQLDFLLLVLFLTQARGAVLPTFKVWLVSLLPAWLTSSS